MNEAVDDKQLGVENDEDGRGHLTRCLSAGARYPCYATVKMPRINTGAVRNKMWLFLNARVLLN